jgi:hypothetical protein
MKEIAEKLAQLEQEIAEGKGSFLLFALFLREDAPDLWDLLVSAPWITRNKERSIKYLADRAKEALKPDELLKLSRIVVIEQDNPALEALQRAISIEHGMTEIENSNFFGLQIKHAYLITSKRAEKSAHN